MNDLQKITATDQVHIPIRVAAAAAATFVTEWFE